MDPWYSFNLTARFLGTLQNLGLTRYYIIDRNGHSSPTIVVEGQKHFRLSTWEISRKAYNI